MKKLNFIIIASFLIQFSFAQNYETIKSDLVAYFSDNYYSIRLDSITNSDDTIFYHNFKMIRPNNYNLILNGSSWTGKNIIKLSNGFELFVNKENDTIFINTQAEMNEKWLFYSYSNGNYIEAEITSISSENFIGITDNVKTISFQLKNSDGNNITNEMNDRYLKLSENYGFIRIFNFYEFPFDYVDEYLYPFSAEMDITGIAEYGHQNFGAAEIYNYSINDELHIHEYHYEFECPNPYCENSEKNIYKIIDKRISDNQDTIEYLFDKCGQNVIGDNYTQTWHYETEETIILSDTENERLNNLNFQPYHDIVNNQYIITASNDSAKWIHAIFEGEDINNLDLIFFDNEMENRIYYYNGLGSNYYGYFYVCCIDLREIVYYKKEEIEWGEPYDCSVLTATETIN